MYSLTANPENSGKTFDKKLKILIYDEINKQKYEIKYHCFGKISGLKDIIYQKSKIPKNKQQLFLNNHIIKKKEDDKTLDEFVTDNNFLIAHLQEIVNPDNYGLIKPYQTLDSLPEEFENCIFDINQGFFSGLFPKLSENGTSGTYFLQNVNRKSIAVFKPRDEEPFMPNNPRGYNIIKGESIGFRKGIRPGESHIREIAAFLLDKKQFHHVPATSLVEVYHNKFNKKVKKGSLQMFINHDDVAGNYSCSLFTAEEVHKIALLDIRILNCDRNEENILIKKMRQKIQTNKNGYFFHLIPIDHGLCLPDCFETLSYEIVWMEWPQVKEDFSKKTLEFIDSIDPKKDLELLCSKLNLRKKCLQNFYLVEILLKNAAQKGFTLFEIGNMIYKDDEDVKTTEIQKLIEKTKYIYRIIKSSNNRTLDKWVERSIMILKEKKKYKEKKKDNKVLHHVLAETILEEDNEEEVKKNFGEEPNRRRLFSDNVSLLDDEGSLTNKLNPSKILKLGQSPGTNSNSTEDDLYLYESIKIKNKISKKYEIKSIQKSPENSLALKRSLSLPYFKRNDSKFSKNSDEIDIDGEDIYDLEKKTPKKGKKKTEQIKKLKSNDIYDDMFIYYFESFANQLLDLKVKEKKRTKNMYRNRFLSTETNNF